MVLTVNRQPATENLIKPAIAFLLPIWLFHMPYGYYQVVRFIAVVGFAILSYCEYDRNDIPLVIVFVALAFLIQPLADYSHRHIKAERILRIEASGHGIDRAYWCT